MSVSINVQFTGQTDGPNHRKVISDIKTMIEAALVLNGIDGVKLYATEQEVTTASKLFPNGESAASSYTQNSVVFSTGFHVNEAPAVAQTNDVAAKTSERAPVDSVGDASEHPVVDHGSEDVPVDGPAPVGESSDDTSQEHA